jgi:Raf kinase inhibitor-like YbhB/YbcL family protein
LRIGLATVRKAWIFPERHLYWCFSIARKIPLIAGKWLHAQLQGGNRMKKIAIGALFIIFLAVNAGADRFTLTSPQLHPGGRMAQAQVYKGFGCTGQNISPALHWSGEPAGTKSFAVTVYDPDAPTGSGWWHWVIFNIPAGVHELKENAGHPEAGLAPPGSVQGRTDFGQAGYGGACPPSGDKPHRYIFTLYALDKGKLDPGPNASAAMIGFYLHQHALAKTSLTVKYSH